jgi:hypothetical protein
MLTIKDVKAFAGLDQKAIIREAETIGRNGSTDTVYGKAISLAIASGMTAKAEGLKGYSFDRAFDAFAKEFYIDAADGTLKAYRSAFGTFCSAGIHARWNASDVAVRVFNEKAKDGKALSLTQRSGMLSKLLKHEKEPTAKEYAAARPTGGNRSNEATLKGATSGLLRSVDAFGVKWMSKLDEQGKAMLADIRGKVDAFAKAHDTEEPAKPAKGKAKAAEPTFADKRKAMLAELAKLSTPSKGGAKTIN